MVQIITDSSTLYTVEQAKEAGFEAVPLCVNIGEIEGRDLQVDMADFYKRISEGQLPQSSQPPVGDVVDAFEKYADCDIINISMADGLSGTYQTACMAKGMVENNDKITVINSKTLCGPHRYMVEKAQEMKEAGCSAKEIIDWVNAAIEKTESFLIPQDFGFLKRGGRLTPVAAALGSVLKLKPVMTLTEDCKKLDKFCIKRTMGSAVKAILDHMEERQVDARHIVYVVHADALKEATQIKETIEERFPGAEVCMMDLSPVFVTQGGPQCIAIQYIEK